MEDIPVLCDVVAVDLPEDAPKSMVRIKGLVPRPYASLHCKVFLRVAIVVWALNFIHVPDVPIASFNPLAGLETVGELVQKKMMSFHLMAG